MSTRTFLTTTALGTMALFMGTAPTVAPDSAASAGPVTKVQDGINLRRIQAEGAFGQVMVGEWRASQPLKCSQATTASTPCSNVDSGIEHTTSEVGSDTGRGTGNTASGTGSSGSGGCVLGTYFYRKGLIPKPVFAADIQYGIENVSDTTLRGYHAWGVPLVALLQTGDHPWLERFLFRAVSGWAHQMAYKKGAWHRPNLIGWAMTKTVEPLCTLIGLFTAPKDYRKLLA